MASITIIGNFLPETIFLSQQLYNSSNGIATTSGDR
jgi:hypothetical protein